MNAVCTSLNSTRTKRIRKDRLIGFRLSPAEYMALTSKLAIQQTSISSYLRRLVKNDLSGAIETPTTFTTQK